MQWLFSYLQAAQSESSRRSYALDIRHFKDNGGKIPATPTTVAEYLAAFAGTLAVASLQHRLIAIHKAHTDNGLPSPVSDHLVKRTMQGIRRTFGVAQRRVKAIVKDDLLEMMVLIDRQKPMKAAPVLLETFMEAKRHRGTCYKAANWVNIGQTIGRGKNSSSHRQLIPFKDIWLYPLRKNFAAILCR